MKFRATLCSAVFLGAMALTLPAHGEEQPAPPDKEKNPVAELLCTLGDPNCPHEEPAPSS
ncbi:MAG: hypothetical protein ACRD0C_05815 [Acidimicrobiia bacterium]